MNNVVCSKGHVYDADKHSSCPYCGVNIGDFQIGATSRTQPLGGGMQPHYLASSPRNMESGRTQPLEADAMAPHKRIEKTCALDSEQIRQKETNRTVALYSSDAVDDSRSIDPVVGWLVAINGEEKGSYYPILAGGNQIGRSPASDILLKDESVSREEHANITYDAQGNAFYIVPGAKRGVTYLNNEIVLIPKALKNYDRLKFGKAELIFVALCGEAFKW